MSDDERLPERLFQCPGCWSYYTHPGKAGSVECECGERATLIDLRARVDSLTDDEPRRSAASRGVPDDREAAKDRARGGYAASGMYDLDARAYDIWSAAFDAGVEWAARGVRVPDERLPADLQKIIEDPSIQIPRDQAVQMMLGRHAIESSDPCLRCGKPRNPALSGGEFCRCNIWLRVPDERKD